MKKTILALTVTSLFSGVSLAHEINATPVTEIKTSELAKAMSDNSIVYDKDDVYLVNKDGKSFTKVDIGPNGELEFKTESNHISINSQTGEMISYNSKEGKATRSVIAINDDYKPAPTPKPDNIWHGNHEASQGEIEEAINAAGLKVKQDSMGNSQLWVDNLGGREFVGNITEENGVYKVQTENGEYVTVRLDKETGQYQITGYDGKDFHRAGIVTPNNPNWKPNNDQIANGGKVEHGAITRNELNAKLSDAISSNNVELKGNDIIGQNKHGKFVKYGEKLSDGSYSITDPSTGESYRVEVDEKGNASSITYYDGNGNSTINKVVEGDPKPTPPIHIDDAEADAAIKEAGKVIDGAVAQYDADVKAAQDWARQAEAEFKQEVARLDSKIDTMEGRVSNGTAMVGAMSQMQFGRDGLGIGAGVSQFNGSKAVAVGVGYAFGTEKQWMAKGSFGYAESKKGKGSKDTMAAAGLTYSFK